MAEPALTATIISKGLSKIAEDIYNYGKAKLATELKYLRNEQSLKKLGRSLRRIETVKTFWSDNKQIPLSSFYYPSRITMDEGESARVHSLAELPPAQCYVIEGTVGQGKSIFLRYLAAQELARGPDSRIPLLAELRFLQADETFETFLCQALTSIGLAASKELFDIYAGSGKIVLFLDAFDEIDPELVTRTIRDLDRLMGQHPSLQIVVTARPKTSVQQAAGFRVVQLAPLSERDHASFVRRLTNNEEQTKSIINAIHKSSSQIDTLLTTPLLLTLLVMLYAAQQHIPDTVSEFYSELFDVLFYKHDRTKSGFRRKRHLDLSDQKVKRVFEAACFYSVLKSYRTFRRDQFNECVEQAAKHVLVEVDVGKFRDELVKTACLLKEEGLELEFIHKSVQEFYSASFVARSSDGFAKDFYSVLQDARRSGPWHQQLDFLREIDEWRYARFYWIPCVEAIPRYLSLSPKEFYSGSFGVNDQQVRRLLVNSTIAFKFSIPSTSGETREGYSDRIVWSQWATFWSAEILRFNDPVFQLAMDTCPVLSDRSWVSGSAKARMRNLSESVNAYVSELDDSLKEDDALGDRFNIEGLTVWLARHPNGVVRATFETHPLLEFADALPKTRKQISAGISNVAQTYRRYTQLVEAESQKTILLDLMKKAPSAD